MSNMENISKWMHEKAIERISQSKKEFEEEDLGLYQDFLSDDMTDEEFEKIKELAFESSYETEEK